MNLTQSIIILIIKLIKKIIKFKFMVLKQFEGNVKKKNRMENRMMKKNKIQLIEHFFININFQKTKHNL